MSVQLNAYIVTCTVAPETRRFERIERELDRCVSWTALSATTWLVATEQSAEHLMRQLRLHAENTEAVYVMGMADPMEGYGPQRINQWLNRHVPRDNVVPLRAVNRSDSSLATH
ncbi:hypothetical protein [Kushneria phosphatilytica]|uniref:Uncharacterized protein n=1 Tax=Kushneria phosphatilytica TaxID=657387 RepID=A0A1S1NVC6_9GAMM|nr:hypothetical protein [Kushneria phosphatilytica]OHV07717.1 hypothetical protein BH688_16155 [Kushneria phosphatilytica]QEL10217.1 hypothetical protein FY550_03080 [Kushneria phosphatilytica]